MKVRVQVRVRVRVRVKVRSSMVSLMFWTRVCRENWRKGGQPASTAWVRVRARATVRVRGRG